jgi:DNA uptake protein ComE-like DNA-binding protein
VKPPQVKPYEESLPLDNGQVADRLDEVAGLLEAQKANPFRARAYRTAAQTLRGLEQPARVRIETEGLEGLTRLPGVGPVLARSIEQLTYTGRLPLLDRLHGESDPESLLATVPGVGEELAGRIREQLGITSLEELELAVNDGRLAQVPGMGPKRLRAVRESLAGRLRRRPRARPSRGTAPDEPPVAELLDVDEQYRHKAEAGELPLIAPRRFNPTGQAWLPVWRTRRGPRRYTALYSNTAQAHRLGMTRDWVVLYWADDAGERQWTVVTAKSGALRGRRVVRGREAECAAYYAGLPEETPTAPGSAGLSGHGPERDRHQGG